MSHFFLIPTLKEF